MDGFYMNVQKKKLNAVQILSSVNNYIAIAKHYKFIRDKSSVLIKIPNYDIFLSTITGNTCIQYITQFMNTIVVQQSLKIILTINYKKYIY